MLNISRVGIKKLIDSYSLMLSVYERVLYNTLRKLVKRLLAKICGPVRLCQSVSFHLRGISRSIVTN